MANRRKDPSEHRIRMSVSMSPGLFALMERLRGEEDRSAFIVDAVGVVDSRRRYRPNGANVKSVEREEAKARKAGARVGLPGKEHWAISRSISFPPEVLASIDAHRRRLGMDRSRYVVGCIEHRHGVRMHPELFGPTLRS